MSPSARNRARKVRLLIHALTAENGWKMGGKNGESRGNRSHFATGRAIDAPFSAPRSPRRRLNPIRSSPSRHVSFTATFATEIQELKFFYKKCGSWGEIHSVVTGRVSHAGTTPKIHSDPGLNPVKSWRPHDISFSPKPSSESQTLEGKSDFQTRTGKSTLTKLKES